MTTSRTPPPGDRVQPRAPRLTALQPLSVALAGLLGVCAVAISASPSVAGVSATATAKMLMADGLSDDLLVQAQAPADNKPRINVGKVILVEPASETPMPIQVGPLDVIPRNSFVRLRGLPGSAVLSEGHSIAPGAWAIPLSMLSNLRVSLPVGLTGKSDISIALVQIDGTVLAEARASLVIAAASMIAPGNEAPRERSVASVGPAPSPLEATPPPAAKPPVPPAASQRTEPAPLTEEQQRATAFITRGRSLVEAGNISAARLFYRRAADAGLADGALALAGTYDPVELARMRVAGVQPDVALAREWYEKARALGAREADERLQRLGSR